MKLSILMLVAISSSIVSKPLDQSSTFASQDDILNQSETSYSLSEESATGSYPQFEDLPDSGYASGSYNMVNYKIQSSAVSFEYFNPSGYAKRTPTNQDAQEAASSSSASTIISEVDNNENNGENLDAQSGDDGISLTAIIGDDSRTLVTTPKEYPYKGTACVKSCYKHIYNNVDGKYYDILGYGTGFLVGGNVLATAGHVVYGDPTEEGSEFDDGIDNPRFPDTVEIYFGLDGETEMTSDYKYYAEALVINIKREFYESRSADYDWAAVELDRDVGDLIGFTYDMVCDWYEQGHEVFTWGYPGDKPKTMWESYGKTLSCTDYKISYDCDTVGGQSGSPMFEIGNDGNMYVFGIHTTGSSSANGAVRFTSFIYHYLNSFVAYRNYEHAVATITPTDYGFADAYPTSSSVANNWTTHTLSSGFSFRTRRYRTGYIHNEYIVMSCIRKDVNEAYIVYDFDTPICKIEVELSHWRKLSTEMTYPIYCTALLRSGDESTGYTTYLDLLDSSTALPTDRTNPTTYTISFPEPVYSFEFYSSTILAYSLEKNRGRICIGDMTVYSLEGTY